MSDGGLIVLLVLVSELAPRCGFSCRIRQAGPNSRLEFALGVRWPVLCCWPVPQRQVPSLDART
jgi:hypothetical protein